MKRLFVPAERATTEPDPATYDRCAVVITRRVVEVASDNVPEAKQGANEPTRGSDRPGRSSLVLEL
jgi:hypothetical protein